MQKEDEKGASSCNASSGARETELATQLGRDNTAQVQKQKHKRSKGEGTHIILCAVKLCSITKQNAKAQHGHKAPETSHDARLFHTHTYLNTSKKPQRKFSKKLP